MKVSSFALPDATPQPRPPAPGTSSSLGVRSWVLGGLYFAAHVFLLAPSLEDIDSINFALGLRDFNPAEHQPHPPGYPIYIAAGRLTLAAVNAAHPALERVEAEALALSLLSAFAGALALVFASRVFGALTASAGDVAAPRRARWAAILLAVCPLFWMTGVRPMSDMPGLAAAFAAQALLLTRRLPAGAFLAGLALGVRSQTLWLTAPLLVLELLRRDRSARERAGAVLLAAAGSTCWAVPLVAASGGVRGYLAALGTQAGEDFAFVDMLWASPTPRRLAWGLYHTLVMPWVSVPLAAAMLALAGAGALVLFARNRRVLGLTLVAFAPYAAFHLVFQETVTTRYALPAVAPIVFLAASALAAAGRATNIVATPIAAIALLTALPATVAYSRDRHPAFRAVGDAVRRAEVDRPAMIASHFELRRPLRVSDTEALPVVYAPRQREWMELAGYWSEGGRAPVWFLANPRRTDLDLIDPHSRRDVVRYRWAVEARPELSGTRPNGVDWYRLRPPGWFLSEGWSLTPETGGVAQATRTGPDWRPIVGYVRAHAGPMHLMVGGRHLGTRSNGAAAFEMALDGAVIDRWTLTPEESAFLRFLEIPAGIPGRSGSYARLTVAARPAGGQGRVPVAVRQFDVQPTSRVIFGFGPGWHDEEYDAATGLRWRWASDRAVLWVRGPFDAGQGRPVPALRVSLRGESPLKYFDQPPVVTLFAGSRMIERLQPAGDWEWHVVVPPDAVSASNGELRIETSRVFVPSEIMGSPDTRRLGLRIFAIDVASAR